ncbi:MAG: hypothetical protein NVS1B10_04270 [Candidatus Saccharimonadales bacterium]
MPFTERRRFDLDKTFYTPELIKFNQFKAELCDAVPIELIPELLDALIEESCNSMLDSYNYKDAHGIMKRQKSFDIFSIAVMARNSIDNESRESDRSWIDAARNTLDIFIEKDPENRHRLKDIAVFTDDPLVQRKLYRHYSAAHIPAGEYDNHSLAAGIILGKITI